MDNGRTNLTDMLDHQPDLLADAKVKVMVSDIYDNIVAYVDRDNAGQVAGIISTYGIPNFIEWFIDKVYLPKVADVKVMSYVAEHKPDIIEILGQAMSNLTAKEALDNADDDKVDDGSSDDDGSDGGAEKTLEKAKDENRSEGTSGELFSDGDDDGDDDDGGATSTKEYESEIEKAFRFLDSL